MTKFLGLLITLLIVVCSFQINTTELEALSQELIDHINNHPKSTWKAAPSTHFKTIQDAVIRLGVKRKSNYWKQNHQPKKSYTGRVTLPESFDARKQWPECSTISQIRDQSTCGSCWAFGAVETMSDRICIHSNATVQVELSARDLISCCTICGDGCRGGYAQAAWDYWVQRGIVSGGSLENPSGCQPYPFPSCEHTRGKNKSPCDQYFETPKCRNTCSPGYNYTYGSDKHYGKTYYEIDNAEEAIMEELMTNGPIQVLFDVYQDFFNYKSGIYSHITSRWAGGHAAKLLGWGVENGIKYWLLANSWNEDWGENGFFRVLRGVDECGIESETITGLPRL